MGKIVLECKENPEQNGKDDGKLLIYDKEINDAIRAFAKTQGDSKYYFG